MPENIYEILSMGARYWFALLGLLIVWRSFRWLRKDRRAKHRRLKQLPDAGMIGEMVVLRGSDELPEGASIPVPREGVLGYLRCCDIVVPVDGVAGKHVDFAFQDGKGLLLFPLYNQTCVMDGQTLTCRTKNKNFPMHHGSRLEVGDALLRLRLFAGLETERHSAFASDGPTESNDTAYPEQQPLPMDWQGAPVVYRQIPAAWSDSSGRLPPVSQPWQAQGYPPVARSWEAPEHPSDQEPYAEAAQEQSWIPPEQAGASDLQTWITPAHEETSTWSGTEEDFPPAQVRERHRRVGRRRGQ